LLVTDSVDADSAALADNWLVITGCRYWPLAPQRSTYQADRGGFVKDGNGAIVLARLDSSSLAGLAQKGQGIYQPVTAGDDDVNKLSNLFNSITENDKAQDTNLLLQQWDEKGPWLLLLILPWRRYASERACCLGRAAIAAGT